MQMQQDPEYTTGKIMENSIKVEKLLESTKDTISIEKQERLKKERNGREYNIKSYTILNS